MRFVLGLSLILFACLALVIWLVMIDAPLISFLVRLYRDKYFLRDTVAAIAIAGVAFLRAAP